MLPTSNLEDVETGKADLTGSIFADTRLKGFSHSSESIVTGTIFDDPDHIDQLPLTLHGDLCFYFHF